VKAELEDPEVEFEGILIVSELCSSEERQWRDCVEDPRDAFGGIGGGCHGQTSVPRIKRDLVAKKVGN